MRRWLVAVGLVVDLITGLHTAHADSSSTRTVVDRAELEPSALGGYRLRVFFSSQTVGGTQADLTDAGAVRAFIGKEQIQAPYALGRAGATTAETAIVVIVEASGVYADVDPVIVNALDANLLAALTDKTTQVAILPYGEATGSGKLVSVKNARARLGGLQNDATAGEPAMLDTVERALVLLRKIKPPDDDPAHEVRKLIVIVGDGRDRDSEHERVTRIGQRAAKDNVRIHTIAFSPTDQRRPLLALGELSKRSLGTFRWVRSPREDSWAQAVAQLRDEVVGQYVATFFVPDADLAGKKLRIQTAGRVDTTSKNEVKIPEAGCAGNPCDGYCAGKECVLPRAPHGRGILGWILLVGGIAVGAILLLGVLGYFLSRGGKAETKLRNPPKGRPIPPGKMKSVAPKSVAPKEAAPTTLANGRPAPMLLILSGPNAGKKLTLQHGFTVGKDAGCDLVIDDGYTSSVHANISMDTFGNCRLYDNQSTNGIFVNGVRVHEYVLQHGVTMKIGSTDLRFLAE